METDEEDPTTPDNTGSESTSDNFGPDEHEETMEVANSRQCQL